MREPQGADADLLRGQDVHDRCIRTLRKRQDATHVHIIMQALCFASGRARSSRSVCSGLEQFGLEVLPKHTFEAVIISL